MAILASKHTEPPDGFVYTQKETLARMQRDTLLELVEMVRAHRVYHGLKPDDEASVQLDIERQICLGQFPGVCRPEPSEDYRPYKDISRTLTLAKIESLSHVAFEFVRSGAHFVGEEEAERRATICRGCKFNYTPNACLCTPLWKMIAALIPSKRKLEGLRICAICGCSLQAKVLMTDSVLKDADQGNDFRYPDYCWNKSHAS